MIEFMFAVALSQQQIQDQCTYQAGVARAVQEIRQTGDSWEDFKANTDKIYQDDEGYQNLLGTAYLVYHKIPIDYALSDVFAVIYDSCNAAHYRAFKKGPEFTS